MGRTLSSLQRKTEAFFITHVQVQFRLFYSIYLCTVSQNADVFLKQMTGWLPTNRPTVMHFSSLFFKCFHPALVWWPPTCSHSVFSALFSFRLQSGHTVPSPSFFQCNRSFQQCASVCLILLYCSVTANSSSGFFVFVVTPNTLQVVVVQWVGGMKGGSWSKLKAS